jgi:hypothetical protein
MLSGSMLCSVFQTIGKTGGDFGGIGILFSLIIFYTALVGGLIGWILLMKIRCFVVRCADLSLIKHETIKPKATIILTLIFILFSSLCSTAEEIVKQVDENGKVYFTNEGISQPSETRVNTDNYTVKAYYKFADLLSKEYLKIKNDNEDLSQDMEEIDKAVGVLNDRLSGKLDSGKLKPEALNKFASLKGSVQSMLSHSKTEKEKGNRAKALILAGKSHFCSILMLKIVADDYFQQTGIEYTYIAINDNVCFDTKTQGGAGRYQVPRDAERAIETECNNKWGHDYRMIEYCIKEQTQAKNIVAGLRGPILDQCAEKWGSDYRMIIYCTEEQTKAKERLGY